MFFYCWSKKPNNWFFINLSNFLIKLICCVWGLSQLSKQALKNRFAIHLNEIVNLLLKSSALLFTVPCNRDSRFRIPQSFMLILLSNVRGFTHTHTHTHRDRQKEVYNLFRERSSRGGWLVEDVKRKNLKIYTFRDFSRAFFDFTNLSDILINRIFWGDFWL